METVLITGASSGIGLELAKCFAADGCRLILSARNQPAMEKLAAELKQSHQTQSEILPANLAEPDAPARIFDQLKAKGTQVDILVNNAGFGARGPFSRLPLDRQLEMLQVNVTALTHLTRLFLPGMIERKRGGILNVASTAAFQPGPGMAVYYASKAYVLSLSEALAEEVADAGVTISALCPGPTDTNFVAVAGSRSSKLLDKSAMTAEAVARIGHRAYRGGRAVKISGLRNAVMAFGVRLAPRSVVRKVAKKFNEYSFET